MSLSPAGEAGGKTIKNFLHDLLMISRRLGRPAEKIPKILLQQYHQQPTDDDDDDGDDDFLFSFLLPP